MGTSIGKLSLMIGADASQLEAEMKRAEMVVNKTSLSDKLAGGVKDLAGKADKAFSTVRTGLDLMRGKTETTGQTLGALGSIASSIPGPWGAAAGAVLTVAGGVVDYLQGPLLKSQRAVRQGFMDVARGVKTVDQAMRDVKADALAEGLEKIVKIQQRSEQFAGGAFESVGSFFQTTVGGVGQAAEATPEAMVERMEQRERMMRDLLANRRFQGIRGQIATEGALGGLEEMARAPRLMLAQRTINRSLRGEQGFNRAAVETNLMAVALDRFRSQNIEPTIAQLLRLQVQAATTAEALRQQYAALAADQAITSLRNEVAITNLDADAQQRRTLRLAGVTEAQLQYVQALQAVRNAGQFGQQLANENEQLGRQIATFGMTSREAQIFNNELRRRDVLTQIANANTNRLGAAERRALQANLDRINAGIEAQRNADRILTQQEAQQQLRQEQTSADARIGFIRAQMAAPGSILVDMSREEAELNQLRLRGAEAWRINLAQANLEGLRAIRTQQAIAQAGLQTFQQTRSPLEQYDAQVQRLETMLRAGAIDETTFGRAIEQASNQLMASVPTEHGGGNAMAEGSAAAQAAIARNNRRLTGQNRAEQILAALRDAQRIRNEQLREQREMVRELRRAGVLRPANLGGGQ